jgi:hypothetical protein
MPASWESGDRTGNLHHRCIDKTDVVADRQELRKDASPVPSALIPQGTTFPARYLNLLYAQLKPFRWSTYVDLR